jgi:hypothetical protein
MEFWALVAFGCESDCQSSTGGEQNELGYPQQCEALIIFQTEVALHLGEMALNIGARIDDQSFPLSEEERGRQFAFVFPAQVVVDGRMGMQEIMDDFEHAPIEVNRIGHRAQRASGGASFERSMTFNSFSMGLAPKGVLYKRIIRRQEDVHEPIIINSDVIV